MEPSFVLCALLLDPGCCLRAHIILIELVEPEEKKYYTGEPTTTRCNTDGSKRHGRAGGGIYNGNFRAAFRVHGPQQVYRAETMASALASELASKGDVVILDNQGVVKATPIKRKGVVKDQDYRDIGYHNASTKQLTIRWTPGTVH